MRNKQKNEIPRLAFVPKRTLFRQISAYLWNIVSQFCRHQVAQSREDRAKRSGARERSQRRRFYPGAPRRCRIQRQRLSFGKRVRQRGMGRAGEQFGVTQLSAINSCRRRCCCRRCHCLLGKRLTILAFRSDTALMSLSWLLFAGYREPIYFTFVSSLNDWCLAFVGRNASALQARLLRTDFLETLRNQKSILELQNTIGGYGAKVSYRLIYYRSSNA